MVGALPHFVYASPLWGEIPDHTATRLLKNLRRPLMATVGDMWVQHITRRNQYAKQQQLQISHGIPILDPETMEGLQRSLRTGIQSFRRMMAEGQPEESSLHQSSQLANEVQQYLESSSAQTLLMQFLPILERAPAGGPATEDSTMVDASDSTYGHAG